MDSAETKAGAGPKPLDKGIRLPQQWDPLACVPLLIGLGWLLASGDAWLLWGLAPGALMFAGGAALLLLAGDPRSTGLIALGAALGLLLTPLALLFDGLSTAFFTSVSAIGAALAAGRAAVLREPPYAGAPPPQADTALDAKVALDEAVLGYFVLSAKMPSGALAQEVVEDAKHLDELIQAKGWHRDPATLHPAPPAPEKIWGERGRALGHAFDLVRFESGFKAPPQFSGAARWDALTANRDCAMRVFKHDGAPRPWLLCVHGYRMGTPLLDLSLFPPAWLHHRLGLNLIQPILPLHGPRKCGLRSGDHFLDGDPLDLLLAEMQSLWDLRRSLAWLRQHEPGARIGVLGYSLGGYNTALLAGYEAELDFAIAGIPAMDFPGLLWRHLPGEHLRYFSQQGFDLERYRRIMAPVSPLTRPALVKQERLFILGGTADRLVPPSQPLLLAQHWGVPVQWYQGSHLSVRRERENSAIIREAVARAAWPVN